MSQDQQAYRRAAQAALVGLLVQIALTLVMAMLGLYAQSPAVFAAAWHFLGGVPVWLILVLLYHQHRLDREEALEAEQMAVVDARADALFDQDSGQLRLARRRLDNLYRWGLATASLTNAVYLLLVGGVLLRSGYAAHAAGVLVSDALGRGVNTAVLMSVAAAAAFVAFVVARYESGMTINAAWQLLRGGAGHLMGGCFTAITVFLAALCAHYQNVAVMGWLRVVIPCAMVLVGAEVMVSLVLSSYRPRRFGQVPRPAFDSRLLGWMTNPGSIAEAISEAINYQFGFEVSRSWFYQLLTRAVAPLVCFGLATLVLLSSLVIVAPYQQAIVTRCGRILGAPLGPGLHVKLPWPIDRAEKYDVGRVHQVLVGSASEPIDGHRAILWDRPHADAEDYLITAPTRWQAPGTTRDSADGGASGISLTGAQVAVQYRIADLMRHVVAAVDERRTLTAIAERCTNAYFATKDIDTLLGLGRVEAGQALRRSIQAGADAAGLGLEVMFVGLISVHPPSEGGVAQAFLKQIGALQERHSLVERAHRQAVESLASVAGSRQKALQIDRLIVDLQNAPPGSAREVEIEHLLTTARGQAAKLIYQARAQRWQRAVTERAAAERFGAEVLAYRNAPNYYRARRYLDALAGGLANARKYILATNRGQRSIYRIDLKDARSTIDAILQDSE